MMICFSLISDLAQLFNKFEPLQDLELKAEVEGLAEIEKFPLQQVFQMDASKHSAQSNAYFFGIGNYKKIVIFDTMLKFPREQILGILCHEIGHWQYMHVHKMRFASSLSCFSFFHLYGFVVQNPTIVRSFGYSTDAVPVTLGVFSQFVVPLVRAYGIFTTLQSRKNEFEAERHAVKMGRGQGLRDGLVSMFLDNLCDLNPDPWYAWIHSTHPGLEERLRCIDIEMEKKSKKE